MQPREGHDAKAGAGEEAPVFDADAWSRYLTAELQQPVAVRFGRARRNVIVARPAGSDGRGGRGLDIRLSGIFRHAPPEVRYATAKWLRSGRRARRASGVLDAWIEAHKDKKVDIVDPHDLPTATDPDPAFAAGWDD